MDRISNQSLDSLMRAQQMLRAPETLMGRADAAVSEPSQGFGSLLRNAIEQVHEAQQGARTLQRAYQAGDPSVSIEETMVAMNKASLSLQMATQVRTRVVQAYSEIMNMQL